MDITSDISLPSDITTFAESCVAGDILAFESKAISVQIAYITQDDFITPLYASIFAAGRDIQQAGKRVDLLAIADWFEQNDVAQKENLLKSMEGLLQLATTFECVEQHAISVHDKSARRRLLSAMMKAQDDLLTSGNITDLWRDLSDSFDKASGLDAKPIYTQVELFQQARQRIQDIYIGKITTRRSTGFRDLDKIFGGGMNDDAGLYIIAGRPAMGKTAFALQMAQNIGKTDNVLIVSLEMPKERIAERMLASRIGVSTTALNNPETISKNILKIENEIESEEQKAGKVYVVDNPGMTIGDIEATARRVHDLKCVFVDYLGLIQPSTGNCDTSYSIVTRISAELRLMARRLNIPVVVLCQLNRSVEARSDKRPQLSDLRDSGAIEQDADGVILLYRPDYYEKDDETASTGTVELQAIVAKNRHGERGTAYLAYTLETGKIDDGELCYK